MTNENRNYVSKSTRKSSRIHNHHAYVPEWGVKVEGGRKGELKAVKDMQNAFRMNKIRKQMRLAYIRRGRE